MSISRASSSTSILAPITNGTATANGASAQSSESSSVSLFSKLSFLRPPSLSTSPTEAHLSPTMSSSSDSPGSSSRSSSPHYRGHHNHNSQHPTYSEPPPMPRTATLKTNRRRKGSLRKAVLGRGALRERRPSKAGLTIDVPASNYIRSTSISSTSTAASTRKKENLSHQSTSGSDDSQTSAFPPFPSYVGDPGSDFSDGGEEDARSSLETRIGKVTTAFGLGISSSPTTSNTASAPRTNPHRLPPGALAAAQSSAAPVPLGSPVNYVSTTDEEDANSGLLLSTRRRANTKSPLSSYSPQHQPTTAGTAVLITGDGSDWDYSETEWWGWVVLLATWFVFVVGLGSCFGVWSWAWDVGTTPYAPPELEDDPTLPIVGYYPALIILSGVMAWVWVVVAWVGMKYFRHAKVSGD